MSSDSSKKTIGISNLEKHGCEGCITPSFLGFDFEYAYQPIVDFSTKSLYAHEALIRGPNGEGAHTVLSQVNNDNVYRFDQACRVKAVKTAAELNLQGYLSINFMPNAVYRPELCIKTTLAAAEKYNFPIDKIIFEFTEVERIKDTKHLLNIVAEYKKMGFKTAIDDFGAGYAGLNLLAQFQPDIIKIDMELLRGVDQDKSRQIISKSIIDMCDQLGVTVLAEGIETKGERDFFAAHGVKLMQGYLFSKPAFKAEGKIDPDAWN